MRNWLWCRFREKVMCNGVGVDVTPGGITMEPNQCSYCDLAGSLPMEPDHFLIAALAACPLALTLTLS